MAGRGATTFQKRQKEQQRKEKRAEKLARRLQRKLNPGQGEAESESPDLENVEVEPEAAQTE